VAADAAKSRPVTKVIGPAALLAAQRSAATRKPALTAVTVPDGAVFAGLVDTTGSVVAALAGVVASPVAGAVPPPTVPGAVASVGVDPAAVETAVVVAPRVLVAVPAAVVVGAVEEVLEHAPSETIAVVNTAIVRPSPIWRPACLTANRRVPTRWRHSPRHGDPYVR